MAIETIKNVGDLPLNPKATRIVRVHQNVNNGREVCDIREWYEDDEGAVQPTRKGIALPKDKVDDLIKALQEYKKAVKS